MKAEQRKELETNTLADKMGHVMQRVKTSPRRTFITYTLIAAAVLVALWFGWRWWTSGREERSKQWLQLYDGAGSQIDFLAADPEGAFPGKAARFQKAWSKYWDEGIKMIGTDPRGAMGRIRLAAQEYQALAEECKDDPVLEPQALLGQAVAVESLAAQDLSNLDRAKNLYKTLANHDKYKESAEGRFAEKRLEILNNKDKSVELSATYRDLEILLRIPPAEFAPGKGKGGFKPK